MAGRTRWRARLYIMFVLLLVAIAVAVTSITRYETNTPGIRRDNDLCPIDAGR